MFYTSIIQDTRQAKKIYEKTWVMKYMSSRDAYQSKLVKLFGPSPNMKMQWMKKYFEFLYRSQPNDLQCKWMTGFYIIDCFADFLDNAK